MEVKVGDRVLCVSFSYGKFCWEHGVTRCTIRPQKNGAHYVLAIGEGISACHPGDQFNKVIGRKLALARALKDAKLNKAERTAVWDAYRKTHRYKPSRSM